MKKIKIFNGTCRAKCDPITRKRTECHFYVGAYSERHAVELCIQAGEKGMSLSELRTYWSKGCWGDAMNGIEPQIGVWSVEGWNKPVKRLI